MPAATLKSAAFGPLIEVVRPLESLSPRFWIVKVSCAGGSPTVCGPKSSGDGLALSFVFRTIDHAPRPCVQATRLPPSLARVTASTLAFGIPAPTLAQKVNGDSTAPPQLPQTNTPPSDPARPPLSRPRKSVSASAGSTAIQSGTPPPDIEPWLGSPSSVCQLWAASGTYIRWNAVPPTLPMVAQTLMPRTARDVIQGLPE